MSRDLRDKVIAITGASSGIGAATAIECAKAGMDVAIAARREDKLAEVAGKIEQSGRRALPLVCDVNRDEDVKAFIDRTMETFGRLDVAFANAGYGIFASAAETTDEQMRAIFETNYFGTVRVIRQVVPILRRLGGGHVVICSSAVSEMGLPMYGAYSATKAAQDALADALRAEVAGRHIHVTTVHPIGTRTEFFAHVEVASKRKVHFNTPQTLMHTDERVARAIVRCLRRPTPQVWPSAAARFGVALCTAFPRLGALAMRQLYKRRFSRDAPDESQSC